MAMRGGSFRGRKRGGPPVRLIAAGVVLVSLVGAVFWFSMQAESNAPVQREIRVEATNVGPQ
ncbi:MAG: hypothetical protein SGJ21_03165 [Alphaproteobacteria bacterium]|nr:hypothetical protein [Alphaproteobacteria bacterium]